MSGLCVRRADAVPRSQRKVPVRADAACRPRGPRSSAAPSGGRAQHGLHVCRHPGATQGQRSQGARLRPDDPHIPAGVAPRGCAGPGSRFPAALAARARPRDPGSANQGRRRGLGEHAQKGRGIAPGRRWSFTSCARVWGAFALLPGPVPGGSGGSCAGRCAPCAGDALRARPAPARAAWGRTGAAAGAGPRASLRHRALLLPGPGAQSPTSANTCCRASHSSADCRARTGRAAPGGPDAGKGGRRRPLQQRRTAQLERQEQQSREQCSGSNVEYMQLCNCHRALTVMLSSCL